MPSTGGTMTRARRRLPDRRPARRAQPEAQLQAAVVEHLRLRASPVCLWCTFRTGGRAAYTRPRAFSGWACSAGPAARRPCIRGNSFALELKSPGGRLSEAQLEFLTRFNDAGGHAASAVGIERALACLEAWGLLRGHAS